MNKEDDQIFDDFDVFQGLQINDEQQNQPAQLRPQKNIFLLTDQLKNNLNKKLVKGFILIKKSQVSAQVNKNYKGFQGEIQYVPVQKQRKIASEQLLKKFQIPILNQQTKKKEEKINQKPSGLRLGGLALPQGKSKQSQKVKGILQRFRKHPKYTILAQQLNKLGFLQGFNQIEAQIKKNIHTIDSFRDRCLFILNHAKKVIFSQSIIEVINELIDQFMFQVEQARKIEFQTNLQNIQKNIDKITREITDIKESGNWYIRKKKKNQKNYDQKQIMHIADLVKSLPPAYLVGVWQIVQEKPFFQSGQLQMNIDFSTLKTKKLRQIQYYVKRKLTAYYRSRQRKRLKIQRKQREYQKKTERQNQQLKQQEFERKSLQYEQSPKEENLFKQQKNDNILEEQQIQQFQKLMRKSQSKVGKEIDFMIDEQYLQLDSKQNKQIIKNQNYEQDIFLQLFKQEKELEAAEQKVQTIQRKQLIPKENTMAKIHSSFQLQEVNFILPEITWTDSSDSSMITDQEDSDV